MLESLNSEELATKTEKDHETEEIKKWNTTS